MDRVRCTWASDGTQPPRKGYRLLVYNRTRLKAESLEKEGAQVAGFPQEVASRNGVVVFALWDSDATEEVVTREFLDSIESGVHIGMCTGSTEGAQRLAKLHADHGSSYVEAPVFGRPEAALARQLVISYVGSQKAKDRAKPILTALGAHALFDLGEEAGSSTVLKQLGNFLIIAMGRSLAEGLAVAKKSGVDPMVAINMLSESVFTMPIFRNYGTVLAAGESAFGASQIPGKDLDLSNRLANKHTQANPIGRLLLQLTLSAASGDQVVEAKTLTYPTLKETSL